LIPNCNLYLIKSNFNNFLTSEFKDINFTRKIQNIENISFTEFETELKKQKFGINDNFQNKFEITKQNINEILKIINETDNQINKIVYQLYELTEEEINILEN